MLSVFNVAIYFVVTFMLLYHDILYCIQLIMMFCATSPSWKLLLIRFVTARTATSREVFRVATAAAEMGEPLAIAPAAQSFVAAVRSTLRERGVLMESLEEYPPQEGKVVLDVHFLTQVCVCVCIY